MGSKWQEYRPTKSLWFWSCAGCAIGTAILGFTVGGWVTGSTATAMADDAGRDARIELAATVCVAKFKNQVGYEKTLADLTAEDSWARDDFLANGGWATLVGMDEPVQGAAVRCADMLADMKDAVTKASGDDTAVGSKS